MRLGGGLEANSPAAGHSGRVARVARVAPGVSLESDTFVVSARTRAPSSVGCGVRRHARGRYGTVDGIVWPRGLRSVGA